MSEETVESLAKFGRTFQEKACHAFIQDTLFAEQISDIIKPDFFELRYLQHVAEKYFDFKQKYKTYPSLDVLETITVNNSDEDDLVKTQVKEYLEKVKVTHLNGDMRYIQDTFLEFARKQSLKEGLIKAIDQMESGNYDSIRTIINDSLNKGVARDLGHEYKECLSQRGKKSVRHPISTGWQVLDKAFNGGWERQTLSTFIAPTGAGKSMFLVNCGAAALEQGLNVVYVTLEMADWKIGIRFDSYYSGVEINEVSNNQDKVQNVINDTVKGRLFIKEWPTKQASVQTIRAYLQRLAATREFKPDILLVDYADLLRGSGATKDKRFELEGTYEDLRALAQELNIVVITADQTNRSGLESEIVTVSQIGESYGKAQVCDVILTVSRKTEDKQTNSGRMLVAKSRLGQDGMVYPFTLKTATVKVKILEQGDDPVALFMDNSQNRQKVMAERYNSLFSHSKAGDSQNV